MKQFQTDNFSYAAKDLVPYLLENLDTANLTTDGQEVWTLLKSWDYMYEAQSTAATAFEIIFDTLMILTWDELQPYTDRNLTKPNAYVTIQILKDYPEHEWLDYKGTPEKENAQALLNLAFAAGAEKFKDWKAQYGKEPEWWRYKNTTITHWAPALKPFSRSMVQMGGNRHILNATDGTHGASWRMVVSLEPEVKAWGVYPGGPSGNPGSHHYEPFIETWANGEYYELVFLKEPTQGEKIIFTQTYTK